MHIQSQLITSYFPYPLKASCFVPILKQGKTALENNYTPIYIPKTFSKVFEILVYDTFHTILPLGCNKCTLNRIVFDLTDGLAFWKIIIIMFFFKKPTVM